MGWSVLFIARETVAGETPAAFAISVIVMGMVPPKKTYNWPDGLDYVFGLGKKENVCSLLSRL
jgi:hypothetical protein